MSRLNIYKGKESLLRVKSKFSEDFKAPILLPKQSHLTKLIISHFHQELGHSGIYSVLREMRKTFHITHFFSRVRDELRTCVICKRFNERKIRLNQILL